MSGGHYDYLQYRVSELADQIRSDLERVGTTNEWGDTFQPEPATVDAMRFIASWLDLGQQMAHDMDWCLSGDTGDDTIARQMSVHYTTARKMVEGLLDPSAIGKSG